MVLKSFPHVMIQVQCDNFEDDVSGYTDVMSDKKGNQDNSFLNLMMMVDHGEFLKFS